MRKLGLITGAIALFAAGLVALSGCGPIDNTCVSNEDCASGEVCHTTSQQCLVKCTDDEAACNAGEQCVPASGGEKGCLEGGSTDTGTGGDTGVDGTGGDTGMMGDAGPDAGGCSEDIDCPGTKVCNESGTCVEPAPEYKYLQIKDTSEKDCSSEDPGADLYAAKVSDSSGNVLGWGTSVAYNNTGSSNTYTQDTTVFAGTEPELTEDSDSQAMCPKPDSNDDRFRNDSIVALGCGGAIVLGFKKTEGDGNVVLKEGYKIQIWEYGSQCGNGTDDATKASICTAQSDGKFLAEGTDENGDYATCATGEAGSGLGAYNFTINSLPSSN